MTNDEPECRAGVSPAQSAKPTRVRSARSPLRARWAGGTPALHSWIGLVCTLSVSTCAESGPSTDPADLTVWPNQASHANGDRWVVEHHDQIRRMNPRLLVLNFDNHAPREKLDRLVDQIIAGLADRSR